MLRPLEPLLLKEHRRVIVVITETQATQERAHLKVRHPPCQPEVLFLCLAARPHGPVSPRGVRQII